MLDKLLTPFWNWFVTLLPMWLAPNLVTFIGFMGNVVTIAIFMYYQLFENTLPKWIFYLNAASLFFY